MGIIKTLIVLGLLAWAAWWAWHNYPPFHDFVAPYVEKIQQSAKKS